VTRLRPSPAFLATIRRYRARPGPNPFRGNGQRPRPRRPDERLTKRTWKNRWRGRLRWDRPRTCNRRDASMRRQSRVKGVLPPDQTFGRTHVRVGSSSTEWRLSCDFRFTPKSDQIAAPHQQRFGVFRAMSVLGQPLTSAIAISTSATVDLDAIGPTLMPDVRPDARVAGR
jgi:hypothetical protein